MFCRTHKGSFREPTFLFFALFKSSGLNCEFIYNVYGLLRNLKILFMSSGEKPILTLKIWVTNFWRFQYFEDFDIKFVLLGQNSFEWIAFC